MKKKISKKETNPIYLKIEEGETIENKKDFLSLESSSLKIAQALTNYKILRAEELDKKNSIREKAHALKENYLKLFAVFPTITIPENFRKEEPFTEQKKKTIKAEFSGSHNEIEKQLFEIQRKLKILEESQ